MHRADAKCGQCRHYVHRPPEIVARCMLDGVCLRTGRAVDGERLASIGGCGSSYVVGAGSVGNGFRERVIEEES